MRTSALQPLMPDDPLLKKKREDGKNILKCLKMPMPKDGTTMKDEELFHKML
jgi:hypothetical protein